MRKTKRSKANGNKAKTSRFQTGSRKDAERLQFIEWLAIPSNEREPKTQAELAQQLGVEPATLSDWKRSPELWEEVRRLVDERVKEHHPEVLAALVRKAKQGDVQAQKLYLQYVYGWAERQRHETEHRESVTVNFSDISDKELNEIIQKTAS